MPSDIVETMDQGSAYIFINFEQPVNLGHIGWGFETGLDEYYFGSTDHLWNRAIPLWHPIEMIRYMDVVPGANNDYWAQFGNRDKMLAEMHSGANHMRYHAYKCLSIGNPDPHKARAHADSLKDSGWNVIRNNCVHQSYSVLTTYGGSILPCPQKFSNLIPMKWFEAIDAEPGVLEPTVCDSIPLMQNRRRA